MKPVLDPVVLDQLFREAHTFNKFADRPVAEQTVRDLYELLKWGPTSMNCQPARLRVEHLGLAAPGVGDAVVELAPLAGAASREVA